jgi:7-cyano-7-deazaguanine tRNA-ribosyltransferase
MMDSDVLVLIKDDLFGLVPLSIDTVYPLSQCDNPKLYPYEKIHNNEFIEEFIQNNKDKIMDITTYNYYTNHYTSNANKNKVSSDAIRINNMIQYQYGFKLNNDELQKLIIKRSKKTNRIRNVLIPTDGNNKEVLFTLRSNDNLLIPAKEGAKLIHEKLPFPKYRVVIDSEVEEFARDGKSVFSPRSPSDRRPAPRAARRR